MKLFTRWFRRSSDIPGWTVHNWRRASHADGYAIELRRQRREDVVVAYVEGKRETVFSGTLTGERWNQIDVLVGQGPTQADLDIVVSRLGNGLRALGYQFLIFKLAEPVEVPEDERQTAMADLRKMGLKPEISADKFEIRLNRLPSYKSPASKAEAKELALGLTRQVQTLHGTRRPRIILARSDGAIDSYL